ncbi:M23 family metallopeptidase [Streptomyces sp. ODS05-4]|uniref:M23 family metallopeptidase n=1 Tax=Streptomyces sp. ODS05-4 TaxID=2944939 RepID=UPI0021099D46|nr:M23 family metallopeptidase [Streptomyces sp. ODS05-4]
MHTTTTHLIALLLATATTTPTTPPSTPPNALPTALPDPAPIPAPAPPPAADRPRLPAADAVWPLGPPRPPLLRGWEPPTSPYGPGHRGVDLAAPPGTPVHAAAAGHVTFAGPVGGRGVLSVTLTGTGTNTGPAPLPGAPPPLRTTYEPVRPLVAEGTKVTAGEIVAVVDTTAARSHCATGCLHWGLRQGPAYLNPLALLPPTRLRRPPSRLLPLSPRGDGAARGLSRNRHGG